MLVSFPDCLVSIETYRKRFIFPYKPCIYSQPCHTWGKEKGEKSRMVIILEPLLFYTSTALTENLSSKWAACKKLPSSEIRDFQSHSAHVKDLLAAVLSWQSLTCLMLAAFSKSSTLSKTCSEGSRCYRGWWVCAKEFTTLRRLIGKIHFRLLGLSNQI